MPEWLEADGLGGYASGTADTIRTRRYHALLLIQAAPGRGDGRIVLVNGFEAWIDLADGPVPLTTQRYAPDTLHPDGATRIVAFTHEPWPTWTYALPDGSTLVQEVFVAAGQTNLRWTRNGLGPARLHVRLLLSGRGYHALHHENPAFNFNGLHAPPALLFQPYPSLPPIAAWGGTWTADPVWYRRFLYTEERDRGLDDVEDLASPGLLAWDLAAPATLALRADTSPPADVAALANTERPRREALPPLHRAARQYKVTRPDGPTLIAGYPWFTDWGRDTFIALRGLLLTTGEAASAEAILLRWAAHVSEGMLPNRFPDGAAAPEYNAVDASLWFIVAVNDLPAPNARLIDACTAILEGYAAGTRYGIAADSCGLLHAEAPGLQLTWMDAKVGHHVITPRAGKPVEVQALWINALRIAGAWPGGARWAALAGRAHASFLDRFPDRRTGGLRDLVDGDFGNGDPSEGSRIRPNQVFAVGGLPYNLLPPDLARSTVDLVERRLLTPIGLRTLDPADPAYQPRYHGDVWQRGSAYHQGTAWPWLLGPFVQAWLRTRKHGETAFIRMCGRRRFLTPLHHHITLFGLGHVAELADGDAPHTPGGCPFQAWSLGELLRIEAMLSPIPGQAAP